MKLLTLNTHSLLEPDQEKKTEEFAGLIAAERPEIFALQEVNQLAEEEALSDQGLKGFVRCKDFSGAIRKGNYAAALAVCLNRLGLSYNWTWIGVKLGYGRYDEGLALFSLSPVLETDSFFISRTREYANWKTRKILGIRTEAHGDSWFYTVHMGWWDDKEEPFQAQMDRLNHVLKKTGKADRQVWLLGDFNSPADRLDQGYGYVCRNGWQDSYCMAKERDDGITAGCFIDGWRNREEAAAGIQDIQGMRLDYLFSRQQVPVAYSRVVCNGLNGPVVSDHRGVMIETEEDKG